MIVETQERNIQRSSSFEEKTMGLAVGSEAFVFNVLRKDLYSDPIGSLIREYTVNAQDEHRKHNKADEPILIQVPNQFTPELHIRDYAGGLTEEQVFNFFGNYGASDKRDSNVAVGFYGLGCKSAFAYTDSYIVKSFKDGMEYTFNIYIDETEIGKTAKISEQETDEPNGIEIIIPVKTIDIQKFQTKVIATIKHFKTQPTIKGMTYEPSKEVRKAIIKGDDWEFFGTGTPNVIMGEIAYPIDRYKMGQDLETWESNILNSDIYLHVNIGDVQVTASREALQMNAKTVSAIKAKLANIKDSMIAETQKSFDNAKNLIEAKGLWNKVINASGYANILKACGSGIKWKGEDLNDSFVTFDNLGQHKVVSYETRRRSTDQIDAIYGQKFEVNERSLIYFDDTDKAQVGYKRRARTLLNLDKTKRIVVIETTDVKGLEKFLGMKVSELNSLNAVVPTKATSNYSGGGTGVDLSKRAKHTSKVFVLNLNNLKGNYGAASEAWDVKEVDLSQGGVYIPIERFKPTDLHRMYDLGSLANVISKFTKAGMTIDIPIYGIKKGMDTSGLVRFDDWMREQVNNNVELLKDYSIAQGFSNHSLVDVSSLDAEQLPDRSIAKAYLKAYIEAKTIGGTYGDRFSILNVFPVTVKTNKTAMKLSEKFTKQYPMLKYVSGHHFGKAEITEYIQLREGENK